MERLSDSRPLRSADSAAQCVAGRVLGTVCQWSSPLEAYATGSRLTFVASTGDRHVLQHFSLSR